MMSINSELRNTADVIICDGDSQIGETSIKYKSLKCTGDTEKPKLYKARFLMMFLYCLCTMLNGFQWVQFAILASVLSCYYNVSIESINWTSIVFMAMYLPFMFPVMWLMQYKGLRLVLVIAAAGNTLSACVQCISLPQDKFYVVLISQTMASIAQSFSVSVAPFLSAIWFGSEEVSRACAVGVFSNQIGVAFGFIVGPLLLPSDCKDVNDVRSGLENLAVGQVVFNFVVFVGIIIFLKDKPPTPPSVAEAAKPIIQLQLFKSLVVLFKDVHFSLFFLTYGILNAVYAAIGTMLNQMVVKVFPGRELDAGRIGMMSIIAGILGSYIFGYVLDKTHRYRFTNLAIYFISLLLMIIYTVIANIEVLWLHYVMFTLMGFFMVSYMCVGYEYGVEISYPIPEGTSGSVLCASFQFLGIIITYVGSWLEQSYSPLTSNSFFSLLIFVGFFISIFIKCNKKRMNQSINVQQSNPSS